MLSGGSVACNNCSLCICLVTAQAQQALPDPEVSLHHLYTFTLFIYVFFFYGNAGSHVDEREFSWEKPFEDCENLDTQEAICILTPHTYTKYHCFFRMCPRKEKR